MATERQLHVFSNGTDKVVAYDIDDAWAVWCEPLGEKREDYEAAEPFERIDDSTPIKITDEDGHDGQGDNGVGRTLTLTARQWADRDGRGFLCSTEW